MTKRSRSTNPDAALTHWLERESRLSQPRPAKISFAQGTRFSDQCEKGCKDGRRHPVVVRDKVTGMIEYPIRYVERCSLCNAEWPRVSVESGRSRRRPREVVRIVDDSGSLADRLDLELAVIRTPGGFSRREWAVHLALWACHLHGLGYDQETKSFRGSVEDIAEAFAADLDAIGREGSPRTVQRMVRAARDMVESRLIEQLEGDDESERRRLARASRGAVPPPSRWELGGDD